MAAAEGEFDGDGEGKKEERPGGYEGGEGVEGGLGGGGLLEGIDGVVGGGGGCAAGRFDVVGEGGVVGEELARFIGRESLRNGE